MTPPVTKEEIQEIIDAIRKNNEATPKLEAIISDLEKLLSPKGEEGK